MTRKKSSASTDFRYQTGDGKVAWPAVGEPLNSDDVMNLIEFLIPPGPHGRSRYLQQKAAVRREVERPDASQ